MSTYSPNLRIELIDNGDQTGTWGDTTNTNLGTLIESAISGYIPITVASSPYALTAVNGGEDQSRNMVINLTTSTGDNYSVAIPPAEKVYIIRNADATYSATIYAATAVNSTTASGGTSVIIPAGKTLQIFCDTTNVRTGITYTDTLSLGSALNIASGGTAQSTYTTGQILYASADNTLSKLNIGTTGQLLTVAAGIPAWGAASASGVTTFQTTLSGLTPSTATGGAITLEGTLGAANGGTGRSTITAGAVVVGTGTAAVTMVAAGTVGNILYDNGTAFVSQPSSSISGGNYILQAYTSNATWTKPAGLKSVKVTVVGGGGGGGSASGTALVPASSSSAAGGGGGGTSIFYSAVAGLGSTVAVTAGAGTNSFGALASATAGSVGGNSTPSISPVGALGGLGASGIINLSGSQGGNSGDGSGGNSSLGQGGRNRSTTGVGNAGLVYGGGGSGGFSANNTTSVAGGAGANGIVIVEEFY